MTNRHWPTCPDCGALELRGGGYRHYTGERRIIGQDPPILIGCCPRAGGPDDVDGIVCKLSRPILTPREQQS